MTEGLRDALEALGDYLQRRRFRGTLGDSEALEEHAERIVEEFWRAHPGEYVRLPTDADGETIHLQDRVSWDNGTFNVHELKLDADGWTTWDELHGYTVRADQCHHVQPDSWERIIEDATSESVDVDFLTLVERCKRLAGEDA